MLTARTFKGACTAKGKGLKFIIEAIKNGEAGFHSSTAKTHIDTFIKLLSYLICAFSLEF